MTLEKLYNLTHPQLGIWNIEMFHQNTPVNNIVGSVKYEKDMDIDLLEKSINILIEKNDALRIRIIEKEGQPLQYIKEYEYEKIRKMDFTGYTDENMEKDIDKEVQRPFNIMDSKLYDFAIYKYNDGKKGVCFKAHHLITDAMSIVNVCSKLTAIYSDLLKNNDLRLIQSYSYLDFMQREEDYKNSPRFEKDRQYWLKKFETFPEFTELKTYNADRADLKAGRNIYNVPKHLTKAFHEYCAGHGVTPYAFLMSTLVAYIARITQKEDITIGTPILNRNGKKERESLGMFISASPLRVNVDFEASFVEHTKNVEKELKGLLLHQAYPYDLILSDFRSTHETSDNLYDMVFSYQNAKFDIPNDLPYETKWWGNGHDTSSITIHVSDRESDGRLIVEIDYLKQLFTSDEIDSIFKHMFNLLAYAILHSEKKVYELEILTTAEKNELLYKFNDTYADYPRDKVVHQLFEEQVESTPDNIALVFEEQKMTYRELNEKSNQLARVLRDKGVGPDKLVGIMVHRSLEMIVGIFAVLKAGGAYVPIDPEYPEERIKYMLSDADIRMLLTQKHLKGKISHQTEKICIELDNETIYTGDAGNLNIINRPNDLVYVIYTSGSTGQPKGVMIEHKNLVNFIYAIKKEIEFKGGKSIISVTTICFDIFALELYVPLSVGMKIFVANEEEQINQEKFSKLIINNKIDMIQTTPSRIKLFMDYGHKSDWLMMLKEVMVGGETCSKTILRSMQEGSNAQIYNMYGPTETTIWSTLKNMTNDKNITIGREISNTQIYILDKYKRLLPKGIKGELFIAGEGNARGYLNNEKMTEGKYIFINGINKEAYSTGDIARINRESLIECLGRGDTQVKIKGFRIELQEIENKIQEMKDIEEVIVDVVEKKGEKAIIAYIVSSKRIREIDILSSLNDMLPYYMIPDEIIKVKEIPLTNNSKIDRKKLKEMVTVRNTGLPSKKKKKPEVMVEIILKKILSKKRLNMRGKINELGLDSLLITRIMVDLKSECNIDLGIKSFYEDVTIKEFIKNAIKKTGMHEKNRFKLLSGGKNKKNLFMIHGGSGSIGGYVHIFNSGNISMNKNYNYYALDFKEMKNFNPINITIEELANIYVKFILEIQPEGEYNLLGWCIGGQIITEVARILEGKKKKVNKIIMINSIAPKDWKEEFVFNKYYELEFIKTIVKKDNIIEVLSESENIVQIWEKVISFARENKEYVTKNIPIDILESIPNYKKLEIDEIMYYINAMRTLHAARVTYFPQNKLEGQLYFINPLADKTIKNKKENISVWNKYYTKKIKVEDVIGDEHTVFDSDINDTIIKINKILE
ncbi:MAG TPA: non-ribosomal peptide synthetase [Clostridiales bacterium]|nr:MAG: hypothetical protein A2Y22_02605 [Clostridiales bacterium GWD2_32_59]HAN08992.1 non-ribosomal peptide synthetase [Clostridiales bacterium]